MLRAQMRGGRIVGAGEGLVGDEIELTGGLVLDDEALADVVVSAVETNVN